MLLKGLLRVLKFVGMFLTSILTVAILSMNIGESPGHKSLYCGIAVFLPSILIYHYFFIWFPGVVRRTKSLVQGVKILYIAVEEAVIDQDLKKKVVQDINKSLLVLGHILDEKMAYMESPSPFKINENDSLEKAWKKFYLDAFSVIDQIKDETLRKWTFNKIRNKLNEDQKGWAIKKALRHIIDDSKYQHLLKDEY